MTGYTDEPAAALRVGGIEVAEFVTQPTVDPERGPRPFLHPVRTMAGVVVTDVLPEDHLHHLGISVAMQDVDRANLWGGRTYVRDQGYTWLSDHGRIEHIEWLERGEATLANRMHWLAPDQRVLLVEERRMLARPVDPATWALEFSYELTNPSTEPVTLGSPATNGRPGKAGYGGFFWRVAPGVARVFDPASDVEEEVNGSTAEWVALTSGAPAAEYTLIFSGLGDGDHWFVRATEYPGVCVALAFEKVRVVEPGERLRRRHVVLVADGVLARSEVRSLVG